MNETSSASTSSDRLVSSAAASPAFLRLLRNPLKFRLFLFAKIPSAFFSGVRVREVDGEHSVVTIPYKWFSQNPFRSTYFACLSMAAEMSTGILAMAHVYRHDPPISMLVTKLEANYFKKAVDLTRFSCMDGASLRQAIGQALASGQGETFRARSIGTNEAGEEIAEFFITWSFKAKKGQDKERPRQRKAASKSRCSLLKIYVLRYILLILNERQRF